VGGFFIQERKITFDENDIRRGDLDRGEAWL
jgi:hypothetical protein